MRRVSPPEYPHHQQQRGWPVPHSPRAVRPASLRQPTLLETYDSQPELHLPRAGTFDIDLDAADPFLGAQEYRGNPFTDHAEAYAHESEDLYVQDYLLGRQPSPAASSAAPRQPAPTGDFYPTSATGQPLSSLEAQPSADSPKEKPSSASFNFFAKLGAGKRTTSSQDSFNEKLDDSEDAGRHFGPAPLGPQTRRGAMRKKVALTSGNLILDCPIPSRLEGFLPRKDADEFKFMKYSAVTADPDDFEKAGFTVRPATAGRDTELCIGVTMYNEDEVLFCRTMHAVMKNISHLCSREKSRTWGKDGWKKVTVVIVADGRKAIHPRVLDVLSAMGVYQTGVAKNIVNSSPVMAHVYEYTAQMSVDPNLSFKGLEKGIVPTQIIFCLKENNSKKINSHRWFFNSFCRALQPNICILLDVGTRPGPKSLYHLWKTFDLNSNVGGACGEITVQKGPFGTGLINPLVACQNFEYKMSNILDKPTESLFGYIQVLPGAFSAYRYIALQNDDLGRGPLASYFKGENLAGHDADILTANIFLAEDRILCWEIVSKQGGSWILKYVQAAEGETDVPERASEWISQRRRWLNGSFFAAVYALSHTFKIFKTEHSFAKKMVLLFEAFYQALNLVFAWFSVANYYIFFIILTSSLEDSSLKLKGIQYANMVSQYLYAFTLVAIFLFSMGNKPKASEWKYIIAMLIFTLLTTYMLFAAAYCIINAAKNGDSDFTLVIFSLVVTYGCYVFSSLLALDPWHLVTCMPQYLLMQAIYINVLQICSPTLLLSFQTSADQLEPEDAFSNIHDLTWGTKNLSEQQTDLGVVKAVDGEGDAVEVILPTDQAAIDACYDEALISLKTRPKIIPPAKTSAQREADKMDYYRDIRSNVLLVYFLTNGILAACVLHGNITQTFNSSDDKDAEAKAGTSAGTAATRIYMMVILGFVASINVFRLIASTAYLVVRLVSG